MKTFSLQIDGNIKMKKLPKIRIIGIVVLFTAGVLIFISMVKSMLKGNFSQELTNFIVYWSMLSGIGIIFIFSTMSGFSSLPKRIKIAVILYPSWVFLIVGITLIISQIDNTVINNNAVIWWAFICLYIGIFLTRMFIFLTHRNKK